MFPILDLLIVGLVVFALSGLRVAQEYERGVVFPLTSVKLPAAAAQITMNPAALELRRMQMIAEVGAENNSTTVLMIPSGFVSLAHSLDDYLQRKASSRSVPDNKS